MSPGKSEAAIILAGGRSRRMGFDKAELEIGGERLIDIVYHKISLQCSAVAISGGTRYDLNIGNIEDSIHVPKGPVAAVFSAAGALKDDVAGFFTVPVDSPNFPDDLCARLYSASYSAVAVDQNGRHPTFGWWRVSDVITALGRVDADRSLSLNRLADICNARDISWPGRSLFYNINSANDLTRYLTDIAPTNMR